MNQIHSDAEMHICDLEDAYHEAVSFLIPCIKSGEITADQAAVMVQPQFDEWFDTSHGLTR